MQEVHLCVFVAAVTVAGRSRSQVLGRKQALESHLGQLDEVSCCRRVCCQGCVQPQIHDFVISELITDISS